MNIETLNPYLKACAALREVVLEFEKATGYTVKGISLEHIDMSEVSPQDPTPIRVCNIDFDIPRSKA